jgi:hypothetical protein
MKWNFESKSEERDYLHNHLISRCNSFCPVKEKALMAQRCRPRTTNDRHSFTLRETDIGARKGCQIRTGLPNPFLFHSDGYFTPNCSS